MDMEIMKTFAARSFTLTLVASIAAATGPAAIAADLVLQKVPALTVEQAPAYPENLARHHLGARIVAPTAESTSDAQRSAESALLSGDPTAIYTLPAGTTTLLVALPKIENLGSISLANKGAKGSVTVATANAKLPADSPQWKNTLQQELSSDTIQAKVGPSEAKYVRLTFDITEPGQISGFGLYPTPQVSDFTKPRAAKTTDRESESFGLISYNYTDMHAKARALYVSSGSDLKQANNMIDDQTATSYSFAADDGSPTTVIDLGKARTLRRLSAVYTPRAGSMEFYVLQSLPTGQSDSAAEANAPAGSDPAPTPEIVPNTVKLNDATLTSMKAVGSATDDGSQGRASVDFAATTGRYVMVRWRPAARDDTSFALAEVGALGGPDSATLLAANTETGERERSERGTGSYDGKTVLSDGKTMIDAKDMPAEGPQSPAEGPPPSLPQPPPFTFVPVLVPTSP
ncbi:MAG: hypothetical protein ABR589_07055 [Chthoniobacterales bacterium]